MAIAWTTETIALLGTMPDTDLAKIVGCHQSSVSLKRAALGIQLFRTTGTRSSIWGTTELGMLGRYDDAELAAITGRSLAEIAAKRKSLGK